MMDGLDFSELSDDQLLTLIRAAVREAVDRHPGLKAAVEAAMLDEAERARIYQQATEREAAALRAAERERVAAEAAERVRREHAVQQAGINQLRAANAAEEARAKAERLVEIKRRWLERAAAVVDLPPKELSIAYINTHYGKRVLINRGGRYERDHLSDWNQDSGVIKTTKTLMAKKPDLAALSAEFAAKQTLGHAVEGTEVYP